MTVSQFSHSHVLQPPETDWPSGAPGQILLDRRIGRPKKKKNITFFLSPLSPKPPNSLPLFRDFSLSETSYIPEVLQVSVEVLILQQLTPDEVVAQVELRHGQYLSFVGRGVAGGVYQVIPVLSTGDDLAARERRGNNSQTWWWSGDGPR